MNTILQQRIEEAAGQYAERRFNTRLLYDIIAPYCTATGFQYNYHVQT